LVLKMIFNFARKRTGKKTGKTRGGRTTDAGGEPVAFGPVYAALSDMEVGGRGVLGEFDMPEHVAEQLMNMGFVPGLEVTVAQSGPGGDPRVYRVDGAEVALRGDLAKLIAVTPALDAERERILSGQGLPAVSDDCGAPGEPSTTQDRASSQSKPPMGVDLSTQEASAD
jgi:ferrous iron transport protein A